MDCYGDEAERRRRARSDAARKRGACRWLNRGTRPPAAFDSHELEDFNRELARRLHASTGNWSAGSSSGASSSRLILVKSEPEEQISPRAVPDAPPRRGVIGPEDYLLERVVLERSAREQEEMEERIRCELEYERLFLQTGLTASQAHTSKEANLLMMKAEQAELYIDLNSSDSD